jgi:4-amino-4-deoxy-L-arabinose transferase-like glycosyltransferase
MQGRPRTYQAIVLILISLILLGLVLRLYVAWDTNQSLPDTSKRLSGDEVGNDALAYALLQGSFFQSPFQVPVYPLFLAGCYLVFGHSYVIVLYVQAFLGATVIPLTFLLARRFTGEKLSLLAAALVALHPALIIRATHLHSENLYVPLLLLTLLSLLWALEAPQFHRFGLAGVPLAIATLCHPATVFFPACLPLLMPRIRGIGRKAVLSVIYASAMLVAIAAWSYHNYQVYNTFLPLSTSWASLWQGSPEFFHLTEYRLTISQIWEAQLNPARNGGHDPFTIEGDRYFISRAVNSILAEPDIYLTYCLLKPFFLWIGHPAIDWPQYAVFGIDALRASTSTLRIVGIFMARLLPLVAVAGLAVIHIMHNRINNFVPLLVICGYFMVVYTITHPEVRYSEPLYPVLATIIAAAAKPREEAPSGDYE